MTITEKRNSGVTFHTCDFKNSLPSLQVLIFNKNAGKGGKNKPNIGLTITKIISERKYNTQHSVLKKSKQLTTKIVEKWTLFIWYEGDKLVNSENQ